MCTSRRFRAGRRRNARQLSIRREPGLFQAMGIPLRAGRALDSHDIAGAPLAVVINESMARRRLPGWIQSASAFTSVLIQGHGSPWSASSGMSRKRRWP